MFLTGRLGVSPIRQTSELNYMVKYYTSRPSEMVFNVLRVSRAPYCGQMLPFLSGQLEVMWCSSVAG